jgi:protease PrsW
MKAFQFDATRLALLRDRVRRGVGLSTPVQVNETLQEEQQLLERLMAYRHVFIGRDPMTPRAVWDGMRYHVTFPDGVVRAVNPPVSPVLPVPVVLAPAGMGGLPAPGFPGPGLPGPYPGFSGGRPPGPPPGHPGYPGGSPGGYPYR